MAKDQKIKDLHDKIDSLHSNFSTKLMEKEKEIYAKIIDYFSRLGHDMNPFKQEVIDEPTKSSTSKKNITKKSSGITPASSTTFTDYFKDASLPNNSILLNTPIKLATNEPKPTTQPIKKAAPKKAPVKAATPKKATAKKTATKTIKTQVKKAAPKKAPIKTATIKKVVTKKPTKATSKKAPVKSASARTAKKTITKK